MNNRESGKALYLGHDRGKFPLPPVQKNDLGASAEERNDARPIQFDGGRAENVSALMAMIGGHTHPDRQPPVPEIGGLGESGGGLLYPAKITNLLKYWDVETGMFDFSSEEGDLIKGEDGDS